MNLLSFYRTFAISRR
uniref:Uncharacterized protein n=1 Tax=Anguilla anguilla TaxID=7936 RepID=A0A0E9PDB4_ANGAN